jgi:hypothetical protein
MEILAIVATLVGIGAGIVAILQWFFGYLPQKTNYRKLFEQEFKIWKDSDYSYIMDESTFKKLIGHMLKKATTEEQQTFALINANHYGNKSFEKFINKNKENKFAIPFIFDSITGKGTRVGWRAEYILTCMNKTNVSSYIESLPEDYNNNKFLSESLDRIINGKVVKYLEGLLEGDSQKLKAYAYEVLTQINSKSAPNKVNSANAKIRATD